MNDLIDVAEAAELLEVSKSYVCRLARDGRIEGQKLGKLQWALKRRSIEEFKAQRERRHSPDKSN